MNEDTQAYFKQRDAMSVKERFLDDTKDHTLEILYDDGLYRHLKFTNNGSYIFRYEIITWPGYLAVTGDMGSYIWQRIEDMLMFFRSGVKRHEINLGYWNEKLVSDCTRTGSQDYSPQVMREVMMSFIDDEYWEFESDEKKEEIRQEVEEFWAGLEECEVRAYDEVDDWTSSCGNYEFTDLWDHGGFKDYTLQYEWLLYGLVYGIEQYDKQSTYKKPVKKLKNLIKRFLSLLGKS